MFRFLAGVLLIVGVSVGAGMLALPMVTVHAGLFSSIGLLLLLCLYMLILAFFVIKLLEVHPKGVHMVSLARNTTGPWGVLVLSLSNCCLLYSVLAAYIAAGGDVLFHELPWLRFVPKGVFSILYTALMSVLVITGLQVTGIANSLFMAIKVALFLLLLGVMLTHVQGVYVLHENPMHLTATISVGVASFTYAMIIPSVYRYLSFDLKQLKRVVVVGTVVSLLIYVSWIVSVQLIVPLTGENGLLAVVDKRSTYVLAQAIGQFTHFKMANELSEGFIFVCLLTTFLGVSLSLSDVIADALGLVKKGRSALLVYAITYLPPLVVVLFFPQMFLIGVNYAGVSAIVYVAMLPALMLYFAKYRKGLINDARFSVFRSRTMIGVLFLIAIFLLVVSFMDILSSSAK